MTGHISGDSPLRYRMTVQHAGQTVVVEPMVSRTPNDVLLSCPRHPNAKWTRATLSTLAAAIEAFVCSRCDRDDVLARRIA